MLGYMQEIHLIPIQIAELGKLLLEILPSLCPNDVIFTKQPDPPNKNFLFIHNQLGRIGTIILSKRLDDTLLMIEPPPTPNTQEITRNNAFSIANRKALMEQKTAILNQIKTDCLEAIQVEIDRLPD